eukprot:5155127-Pyramimonas_sp.AAC.1
MTNASVLSGHPKRSRIDGACPRGTLSCAENRGQVVSVGAGPRPMPHARRIDGDIWIESVLPGPWPRSIHARRFIDDLHRA